MGNLLCVVRYKEELEGALEGLFTREPQTMRRTEKSGLTDARGVGGVGASQEAEVASQRADAPSRCPQDPLQSC